MLNRIILFSITLVTLSFQYKIWWSENSIGQLIETEKKIELQQIENQTLQKKNAILAHQIQKLQSGNKLAIEDQARENLGMIKKGETYFIFH